jgi:hypothetical protein
VGFIVFNFKTVQVVTYVVTRPGRELLFTVVSQDEKYKAKAWLPFLRNLFLHRNAVAAGYECSNFELLKLILELPQVEIRLFFFSIEYGERGKWIPMRIFSTLDP